jgi:hypothetical protein
MDKRIFQRAVSLFKNNNKLGGHAVTKSFVIMVTLFVSTIKKKTEGLFLRLQVEETCHETTKVSRRALPP